jgi:hypothetical protein
MKRFVEGVDRDQSTLFEEPIHPPEDIESLSLLKSAGIPQIAPLNRQRR